MGWRGTRLRIPVIEQGSDYFDDLRWEVEITGLIDEMSRQDPCNGCWEYVQESLAEKWFSFLAVMKRIDAAFDRQDAGDLRAAIATARLLYYEFIMFWDQRNRKFS